MVGFRKTLHAIAVALGFWVAGVAGTAAMPAGVLPGAGVPGMSVVPSAVSAAAWRTAPDWRGESPSADAQAVAQWVFATRDAGGKPFAVVDKKRARIFVFSAQGALLGASPALLGLTRGDDSAAGIGLRAASGTIGRDERTTPAGRFASQPGRNDKGEAIVWVDYAAAVAIHRLRPAAAAEQRPQRLASDSPDDNRISLGCVVVGTAFYDQVVAPTLGRQAGVVYVLPDTRSLAATFGAGVGTDL